MVSSKLAQSILRSQLPSPLPVYRPLNFSGPNPALQRRLAEAAERRVVPEGISAGVFRNNLEKHLNDVRKNKGYLSQEVSREVRLKHQENSVNLNIEQDLASNYSGYYTALDYEQRARYTVGINEATKTVDSIQSASENADRINELLAAQGVDVKAGTLVSEEV